MLLILKIILKEWLKNPHLFDSLTALRVFKHNTTT